MKQALLLLIMASLLVPMACNEDDPIEKFTVYEDSDGDGFGNPLVSKEVGKEEDGYVLDNTDCDDANANINPDAIEIADNEVDENCDGLQNKTWYQDFDEDGYGNNLVSQIAPAQPTGYVLDNTDCDDENDDIHPSEIDIADNEIDENCDGLQNKTWYQDSDEDGYGNSAVSQIAPAQPTGYVLDNTDCNDENSAVNPGATEVSGDGDLDNNCDGLIAYICGDGNVEGDEACDDANTNAGDGCDATCLVEIGYQCDTNESGTSVCYVP